MKLLLKILIINYSLSITAFSIYGIKMNNHFFTVCNDSLVIFTLVNIILFYIIKNYSNFKKIIKD